MSPSDRRAVAALARIYAAMLRAYPADFRNRYGRELTITFQAQARERITASGFRAVVPLLWLIARDWLYSVMQEHNDMNTPQRALRWAVTLPGAILASYLVERLVGVVFATQLIRANPHAARTPAFPFMVMWAWPSIGMFLMSAVFVAAALWLAPDRKASVARIAVAVVAAFGIFIMLAGAWWQAFTPTWWGLCILGGGMAVYLPWRRRQPRELRQA